MSVALDDDANSTLREPSTLYDHILNRLGEDESVYYVLLDEIQYAMTAREPRSRDEPHLYSVPSGLC